MQFSKIKKEKRVRRHKRIRSLVSGTADKPRLCVFKSNKHIQAQLIDDTISKTIVSASSVADKKNGTVAQAKLVGAKIAKLALEKGIKKVVFDRGGFLYVGQVKALADAARESGLNF